MDNFMDKLAQKLTAQEMINANAAADAEELNRLQDQVKEYRECLEQMIHANQEMLQVNQKIQAAADQMGHVMENTIAPRMDKLVKDTVAPKLKSIMSDTVNPEMNRITQDALKKLEEARVDGEQIDRLVQESLDKIQQMQLDQDRLNKLQTALEQRITQTEEFVHKENVKVYRNVQAVVLEESGKQGEAQNGLTKNVTGKMNIVLGVSIAALAASVGSIILQLLVSFHVI